MSAECQVEIVRIGVVKEIVHTRSFLCNNIMESAINQGESFERTTLAQHEIKSQNIIQVYTMITGSDESFLATVTGGHCALPPAGMAC